MYGNIGPYKLIGILGRGGMGVVYKGYETSLNRYVAIKVLADSMAHDPNVKARFLREARSMAALNDPHIIQIYFIGDNDGQTYFAMEFVDGESLGSLLQREGKLKPEQAVKIIYQTALGLGAAHERGVIHRDIKPGNLMLSRRGIVKIADFGIALSAREASSKLTTTGEFVGTPGYLSPEVCQGRPVDQRSDIFSLGIVLFECLAGRMPFTDDSPLGLMLEVVKEEIPDVCALNADVDKELASILTKMVAKDPEERFQTCDDLAAALARHPLVQNGPLVLDTHGAKLAPILRVPKADAFATSAPLPLQRTVHANAPPRMSSRVMTTAVAVMTVAVTAAAWAWQHYSTVSPPATTSVAIPQPQATANASAAPLSSGSLNTTTDSRSSAHASDVTSNAPVKAALLDASWLDDVPDDLFDSIANGTTNSAAPTASASPGNAFFAPMVYEPPPPSAYLAATPWRGGMGLRLGVGYWATRIAAPTPLWFGPALPIQPTFSAPTPVANNEVSFASTPVAPSFPHESTSFVASSTASSVVANTTAEPVNTMTRHPPASFSQRSTAVAATPARSADIAAAAAFDRRSALANAANAARTQRLADRRLTTQATIAVNRRADVPKTNLTKKPAVERVRERHRGQT